MMRAVMRTLGLAAAATGIHLLAAASAVAQQTATDTSCPHAPLSIYFASGDVTASPQAQELIIKISDTATTCHADRVDLIAHIDPKVDGERAVTVALERLNQVAEDLIARGVPADRIRVAARAPEAGEKIAGPNQVSILIRKADETPEPREAAPTPVRIPSDSI